MGIHTYGSMAVDWEERVRFDRLRDERLARIKQLLAASGMGALLCFDMTNIRYVTATHIGTWAQDKLNRFCLLPQGDEPIMWDFGSAARHHQLYNPWLGEGRSRAGISTMRGAMSPHSGRAEDVARKIRVELEDRGLLGEPVGVDAIEPQVLFALQAEGIRIADGQQLMQDARGVGLAGTQVGTLQRVFVFQPTEEDEPRALVNPVLVDASEETLSETEGCLSMLGVTIPVERPVKVTIEGKDETGGEVRLELEEHAARVVQHELDHLDGIMILDRTTPEARREALGILRPEPVLGAIS